MKNIVIPFKNWDMIGFLNEQGKGWIAIRPICEVIGVSWQSQHDKIKTDPKFNCQDILMVGGDGKERLMTSLPVDQVRGWLYSINAKKVKPEVAPLLLEFQQHCHMALDAYFTGKSTPDLVQRLCEKIELLINKIASLELQNERLQARVCELEARGNRFETAEASAAGARMSHHRWANEPKRHLSH